MNRRALVLAGLLPLAAQAELPPSSKWSWSVISGGGAPGRFMLFFDDGKPPPRKAREWWTVETGARGDDGKTPVMLTVRTASTTRKETFTTWEEQGVSLFMDPANPGLGARPLVTRESPPRVLSTERVRCQSQLLGPYFGTCAGRAGGPLQQPELPLVVVVNGDSGRNEDTLAAMAIGVLSGLVLIPGHTDKSVVARMDALPAPRLEKSLETWRKSAHTKAALEKLQLGSQVDAESLGALMALAGTPSLDVVTELAQRAPVLDRWPLLRLARQSGSDDATVTRAVARLVAADALHAATNAEERALEASALVGFDAALSSGVAGMLGGSMPTLRAVAIGTQAVEPAALRALQTASLGVGEGAALAALMSKATLRKSFPDFIERLPDGEGLAVINSLATQGVDDSKLALLQRVPTWVDRVVRGGQGNALLSLFRFDADRVAFLEGVRTRAKPEERPALLLTGMKAMTFDSGRLQLLRKWKATTQLTPAQRLEVLELLHTDAELTDAAQVLLDETVEPERRMLLFEWLKKLSSSERRLEVLKREAPPLTVPEARQFYASFTFGDAKRAAAPVLMSLVPEAARTELFVDFVAAMSFDDDRVELLKIPEAPALTEAQRERVLKSFTFGTAKARALLK